MGKGGPVQKNGAFLGQGQQEAVGHKAQQQKRNGRYDQHHGGTNGQIAAIQFVIMRLQMSVGILLPEQAHIQFEHVGGGEARRKEEHPLAQAVHREPLRLLRQFHQALMNHGFAGVAIEQGNAHQPQSAQQKYCVQQPFSPAIAAQGGQIQGMGVHVHRARAQEEAKLEQRMVYHMAHRARGGQRAVAPQQHGAGQAHRDVPDLRQGGASQSTL